MLNFLLWSSAVYLVGVAVGFFHKPKHPTVLFGLMWGPIRLESEAGDDVYSEDKAWSSLFFLRPAKVFHADDSTYWVTHIQYRSRFGFFLQYPFCFHFWTQPRFQRREPNPNAANDPQNLTRTVPGSELCLPYFRLPGWRASSEGWIQTNGYFGLHWD